jgi:methionyl-tRNA formyltransferase
MSDGKEEGNDLGFKSFCIDRMKKMFDEVLFNVEASVRSDYQFSVLRKRILRSGNNALRDILKEVEELDIQEKPEVKRTETYKID